VQSTNYVFKPQFIPKCLISVHKHPDPSHAFQSMNIVVLTAENSDNHCKIETIMKVKDAMYIETTGIHQSSSTQIISLSENSNIQYKLLLYNTTKEAFVSHRRICKTKNQYKYFSFTRNNNIYSKKKTKIYK